MSSSDVLPTYIEPSLSEKNQSNISLWSNASKFGECYSPCSDSQTYPALKPVYNGEVLDIQPELVHAALSGISIKHYYGMCYKVEEEQEESFLYGDHLTEMYDFDWFDDKQEPSDLFAEKQQTNIYSKSSTDSRGFGCPESLQAEESQPLCALPKINYRNSFWNIHQPELCKLTWKQKYVSAATVTEHLHEHLIYHGPLCEGFHTEEDRMIMLNKELDEYVRLKVLACPRRLPPDEPLFNFKQEAPVSKPTLINPKCRTLAPPEIKIALNFNDRFIPLIDDDEIKGKNIRRSKEEFCLTIGKHIRKTPTVESVSHVSKSLISPEVSFAAEEEVSDYFYYNWFLHNGGETLGENSDKSQSSLSESESLAEPCPPLMLDELCRAAAKADFSDLRCSPDF